MLHIKSKKITLPLCLCVISALFSPVLTQADMAIVLAASDTGEIAAGQAADQRARLAKKAAERKKAAEAKKAAAEAKKAAEAEAKKENAVAK